LHFDVVKKGMELLLTHRILVQFPNLDEVFCNLKNLTHMVYKIGEVLKIM